MNKTVNLTIDGLGIALFSAKTMDYVEPGSDFLLMSLKLHNKLQNI